MRCWCGHLSGARCRLFAYGPADVHPNTPSSLVSFKSRLVLPFWNQLTQVVLERRPLNGYSVVYIFLWQTIPFINIGSNCILWRRICASVGRPFVCLSVLAWAHSSKPEAASLLLWAQLAVDFYMTLSSNSVQWANAGSAMLSAYAGSWTQTCFKCACSFWACLLSVSVMDICCVGGPAGNVWSSLWRANSSSCQACRSYLQQVACAHVQWPPGCQ